MSPRVSRVPTYSGRIYIGLLSADPPRVEVYRGVTADGALRPRNDLIGIRSPRFAWGTLEDATLVLAVSLLAHAFGDGVDDARACALAPLFMAEVLAPKRAFAPWVITYGSLELWVASAEDAIEMELRL